MYLCIYIFIHVYVTIIKEKEVMNMRGSVEGFKGVGRGKRNGITIFELKRNLVLKSRYDINQFS